MNDQESNRKTKNIITASEIASVVVVIASGFHFCKYLFTAKAVSIRKSDILSAADYAHIEYLSFFIAFVACMMSVSIVFGYGPEKMYKWFLKIKVAIDNFKKWQQLLILTTAILPALLVSPEYGFLIVLFLSAIIFLTLEELNRLAKFCVMYLTFSFLFTAGSIFSIQ